MLVPPPHRRKRAHAQRTASCFLGRKATRGASLLEKCCGFAPCRVPFGGIRISRDKSAEAAFTHNELRLEMLYCMPMLRQHNLAGCRNLLYLACTLLFELSLQRLDLRLARGL